MARLEELELKVQHLSELEERVQYLETVLKEQQNEHRISAELSAVPGTANLIENQAAPRSVIARTCRELHQADPSLNSGMYWIDPDGYGVGDDPIYVACDMATG